MPKNKRLDEGRDFAAEIERGEWVSSPPERLREIQKIARRSVEVRKQRGGARAGAGRKPGRTSSLRKAVTFRLRPETVQALRRMAPSPGKVSATLERIVEAAVLKFRQ